MEERMAKGVELERNSCQVSNFVFRSMAGVGLILFLGGNPEIRLMTISLRKKIVS